jgi:CRP-like cAMP-binding protein
MTDLKHFPRASRADGAADFAPLAERGWLAEQPADFRDWVARSGRWRRYDAGQVLYDAGEPPDGLYGLAEGALEITLPLVGDEPVTIHRAEPGFWIGDAALLANGARLVSVGAAAPSRVFRIPAAAVREVVVRRPEYWHAFYTLSYINVATAITLLAEALSLSPRARLARTILRLSDADGAVQASQHDLARLIGMTRSTLQRSLAELAEAGAIATGYRSLTVRDRVALEHAARHG